MEQGEVTKRLKILGKSKAISNSVETASAPQEISVNDGSVPESDMSNDVYKIGAPQKKE